ncbi:MAG: CCA tRNA nucleotidyltransferase [Rhodospirillales bacterium]
MISINATTGPTGKLNPEPWLSAQPTIAVMEALSAGGADVRFVGGCVRDSLAKRPVSDIDIATPEAPETVISRLEAAGIKTVPTGLSHGTVTAIVDGQAFEVTTLRCDLETDGRRAVVAFTDDWIVDSARRDFTINALSANRDGDIYDYHDGIADLAHGRVRFVGRANDRVGEDYLRILRYFRFYSHYGRPPYDSAAFSACRKHATHLKDVSVERIRHEILRTLTAPEPADSFIMMRDAHVLESVFPEATEIGALRAAAWLATRGVVIKGLKPDPVRRLGAVLSPGCDIAAFSERMKLSNRESERLKKMKLLAPLLTDPPERSRTQQLIRRHGNEAVGDAMVLAWAARLADQAKLPGAETASRRDALEVAFAWQAPQLPIGGNDVKAFGLSPGPEIGSMLSAVEDWWASGDFKADRDACLHYLKSFIDDQDNKTP